MSGTNQYLGNLVSAARIRDAYCRNCGRHNVGRYNYCSNCGTSLNSDLTAKPQNPYPYNQPCVMYSGGAIEHAYDSQKASLPMHSVTD